MCELVDKPMGYAYDIRRLLHEYNLHDHLTTFLDSGLFPDKGHWKNIVKETVTNAYQNVVSCELAMDVSLQRYSRLVIRDSEGMPEVLKPSMLWIMARESPHVKCHMQALAQMICIPCMQLNTDCVHCGLVIGDLLPHLVVHCSAFQDRRDCFWAIIRNDFPVSMSQYLLGLDDDDLVLSMLGEQLPDYLMQVQTEYTLVCAGVWSVIGRHVWFNCEACKTLIFNQ